MSEWQKRWNALFWFPSPNIVQLFPLVSSLFLAKPLRTVLLATMQGQFFPIYAWWCRFKSRLGSKAVFRGFFLKGQWLGIPDIHKPYPQSWCMILCTIHSDHCCSNKLRVLKVRYCDSSPQWWLREQNQGWLLFQTNYSNLKLEDPHKQCLTAAVPASLITQFHILKIPPVTGYLFLLTMTYFPHPFSKEMRTIHVVPHSYFICEVK